MRIYFPDDLLPYQRRLDWKQRVRWLKTWKQLTRRHPRYRLIFWSAFVITIAVTLPPGLSLAQRERDPVVISWVVAGLCAFCAFWIASIIPYLFTRAELKRLIGDWLKKQNDT